MRPTKNQSFFTRAASTRSAFLAVPLMLSLWLLFLLPSVAQAQPRQVVAISHRGEHLHHPENTLQAYQAAIDAQAGLQLAPTLQLTEAGYARWKDMRAFLSGLDNGRKLTDAEVKVLEGKAQMFRQSGILIKQDTKEDIKVDTKDGLKVYKSLY